MNNPQSVVQFHLASPHDNYGVLTHNVIITANGFLLMLAFCMFFLVVYVTLVSMLLDVSDLIAALKISTLFIPPPPPPHNPSNNGDIEAQFLCNWMFSLYLQQSRNDMNVLSVNVMARQ